MTNLAAGDTSVGSTPIPIDPKRVAAEIPVRDLNFDLKRLQAAHDDGSHGTRTARSYALAQTRIGGCRDSQDNSRSPLT